MKTNKLGLPLRFIVSEKATWQYIVAGFLQERLANLEIADSYLVPNSTVLVRYLENENPGGCQGWLDVEDLFDAIPQGELMVAVKGCIIEFNDEHRFVLQCGISLEAF